MTIWLPILWIATGICRFAGVHFLRADHAQENAGLFPAFGVLCLAVAAYIAVSALAGLDWGALPFLALVLLIGQSLTTELRRFAHALAAAFGAA